MSIDHGMFNPTPSPRNLVYKVVHLEQNQVRINTTKFTTWQNRPIKNTWKTSSDFVLFVVETAVMLQAAGHFLL